MVMEDISATIKAFKDHGMKVPANKLRIKIENPKQQMEKYFNQFVNNHVWLPEYDNVCQWLSDNKGKGLLLYGDCGRGKTILTQWVLPAILLSCSGYVLKVYDSNELASNFETIIKSKLFGLDDIGTEEMSVEYGNKRVYFAEIMDIVEKQNKLIIVNSNLTGAKFKEKYGERILDRIIATTHRIEFKGNSLRK